MNGLHYFFQSKFMNRIDIELSPRFWQWLSVCLSSPRRYEYSFLICCHKISTGKCAQNIPGMLYSILFYRNQSKLSHTSFIFFHSLNPSLTLHHWSLKHEIQRLSHSVVGLSKLLSCHSHSLLWTEECPPKISYAEALSPSVAVFRDGASK